MILHTPLLSECEDYRIPHAAYRPPGVMEGVAPATPRRCASNASKSPLAKYHGTPIDRAHHESCDFS